MKKLFLILVTLISCHIQVSAAQDVDNPYQIDVKVATQSEQDRNQAMKEGLAQLIEKMSNDETILNSEVIGKLESPTDYVQEYNYEPIANSTDYTLHVTYDKTALKKLFKKAEASDGSSGKPLIMTWLLVAKKERPAEIVSNETPGSLLEFTQQDAKKLGLSVIFPVMDMVDTALVTANDVQNFSLSLLQQVGRRYAADAHLIGTINETDAGFESKWQLAFKGKKLEWSFTAANPEEVIDDVLREINQAWSKRASESQQQDARTWIKLTITNVTERDDLRALTSYLQRVKGVIQFELQEVSGDVVRISLLMRGRLGAFEQNAGQRLQLQGSNETLNQLVYQWVH